MVMAIIDCHHCNVLWRAGVALAVRFVACPSDSWRLAYHPLRECEAERSYSGVYVAQLVEHWLEKPGAMGSSPIVDKVGGRSRPSFRERK